MVKVEGTLAELRELFVEGAKAEGRRQVRKAGVEVVRAVGKETRKRTKSAWQKYISQRKNQIKFKSGSRKGRLDLKRMAAAYRKQQKSNRRK